MVQSEKMRPSPVGELYVVLVNQHESPTIPARACIQMNDHIADMIDACRNVLLYPVPCTFYSKFMSGRDLVLLLDK
jgi:hypothetical protein